MCGLCTCYVLAMCVFCDAMCVICVLCACYVYVLIVRLELFLVCKEMKRFLSSAASSSSGRAEQPAAPLRGAEQSASSSSSGRAVQSATASSNAERPGTASPLLKISSIQDVQCWLARSSATSHADIERIREAVAVLSRPKPRKEDVQPLQPKWQIARQRNRQIRKQGCWGRSWQSSRVKSSKRRRI